MLVVYSLKLSECSSLPAPPPITKTPDKTVSLQNQKLIKNIQKKTIWLYIPSNLRIEASGNSIRRTPKLPSRTHWKDPLEKG